MIDGDLGVDYTHRLNNGGGLHVGGSYGGTYVRPRGGPGHLEPRWEARAGRSWATGRSSRTRVDFHVGGGRGGATYGGVGLRIDF